MARSLANSMGLGREGSLKGSLRGGFGLRRAEDIGFSQLWGLGFTA